MGQGGSDEDRPGLWDLCRSGVGASEELADSAGLGLSSLPRTSALSCLVCSREMRLQTAGSIEGIRSFTTTRAPTPCL
jgi:hypothetical protein